MLLKMTVGIEELVALVLPFLFHLQNLPYIFVNSHLPCMHEISSLRGRFHDTLMSWPTGWDAHCSNCCRLYDSHDAGDHLHPFARILASNFLHSLLVVAVPE